MCTIFVFLRHKNDFDRRFGCDQIYCAISTTHINCFFFFLFATWKNEFVFDKNENKIKKKILHTFRKPREEHEIKAELQKRLNVFFFFSSNSNHLLLYLLCVNGFELIIIVSVVSFSPCLNFVST